MYSASIEIVATPAQVFAGLTDPKLMKQWQPEAVEINSPEGGPRIGATSQLVVREFGRQVSVKTVIVAFEPNARLGYHMTSPMWSGRIDYVLTDKQGSTSVSMLFVPDRPKVNGVARVLLRVVAVLTRPLMQLRLRSLLAGLRRVVEANR